MEIIILGGAEEEIFRAWERYEQAESGRGDRFDEAVNNCLQQIAANPHSGPRYGSQIRRILVRRFGYGIFYQAYRERIVIVAVLDLRQSPENINRRLGL